MTNGSTNLLRHTIFDDHTHTTCHLLRHNNCDDKEVSNQNLLKDDRFGDSNIITSYCHISQYFPIRLLLLLYEYFGDLAALYY
jgi:hypothetical protein